MEKGSRVSFNTMAGTVPHPSMSSRHHPGGGALPLGHKPLWDLMGPSEQHPPLVHLTSSSSTFDQPGPLQLRAGSSGPFLWPWQGRGAQVVLGGPEKRVLCCEPGDSGGKRSAETAAPPETENGAPKIPPVGVAWPARPQSCLMTCPQPAS